MKHLIFYVATLLILPISGNAFAQSENLSSADSTQAEAVMNQYFAALANGDVANIKTLLGGKLKTKRMPLLNNPEYADHLATAHANASFQILNIHSTAPNTISVDAIISLNPDETIRKTYTLKRNASQATEPYRIVSEVAVAN